MAPSGVPVPWARPSVTSARMWPVFTAYGRNARMRCWARLRRAPATIFMARVIFRVLLTLLIRLRIALRLATALALSGLFGGALGLALALLLLGGLGRHVVVRELLFLGLRSGLLFLAGDELPDERLE